MSQISERVILQTNCGKCNAPIMVDATDFEPKIRLTNSNFMLALPL